MTLKSFIWRFIKLQPWKFLFILLLSFTWSLDATIWPYLTRLVIDTLGNFETNREAVWPSLKPVLIAGICLMTFVEAAFRTRGYLQAKVIPKLEADIRMTMFEHVQRHSPKYFNEHFAGSLANKISDMTNQVTLILENLIQFFLPTVATVLLTVTFFFNINPYYAAIMAAWILIHFGICFAFTPKCVDYSDIHGQARSSLAGKIVDSLTNNFAVNLFFRFQFERSRIAISQHDEKTKNYKSKLIVVKMFTLLSVIFLTGAIFLNGLMLYNWTKGKITTGEVIQIFYTTWNLIMIIWFTGEIIPQFYQQIGIARQALTLMNDPQDVVDEKNAAPLVVKKGEIVFDNVSFQYGDRQLFQNKSVTIRGGEKVGLVGFSGAGKSTFVNLILRFHNVEQGRILIDGQDIANITLGSLRHQVALIPQDPMLFHRTLEENIRYGRIDATAEEVVEAAKLAHCDEFIRNKPQGYDSLVGERGTKLSGGERQRIAIARAMLSNAPILLLDEATSALDSVTENYIQESLSLLMENRTTVVIAHRLSTLAKMDRILIFDQGKIVEQGTHDELLELGGNYARMWHMQAGGFLPE